MKTMNDIDQFRSLFKFRPEMSLYIGCEREVFLCDGTGDIKPQAPTVMNAYGLYPWIGYELSACQMEYRIGPSCDMRVFRSELRSRTRLFTGVLNRFRVAPLFATVAPPSIPLDVYPDPTGRYQKITEKMPEETLLSACRITGTHIHVGMPDHDTALRVYNGVCSHVDDLINIGNLTDGQRMRIYQMMVPDCIPQPYVNWEDLYSYYVERGYDSDPRKCWTLVRISVHGTIEFRVFDNTPDQDKVVEWATACLSACEEFM